MPDNDPFAQLDSQLSTNTNVQQQAVQTKPTDNDPFGALDNELSTSMQQANASTATNTVPQSNPNDSGAFMAGVENFNRVFGNIAEGTIDLVARATGSKDLQERVANVHNSLQASADQSAAQHPIAATIGTVTGILGSAALPFGSAARGAGLLQRSIVGGGTGALTGFLNYAPSIQDRMNNGAVGAMLGAAAPVAFNAAGKLLRNSTTGLSTAAGKMMLGTAKGSAINDVNVINSAKNQVQSMLDDFVPGGKAAIQQKQDELYAGLKNVSLDDASTESLLSNTAINKYLQQMEGQELGLKTKLPNNNVAKLDQLKQNIDKDIYNTTHNINSPSIGGFKQTLTSDQLGDLMQARNLLVDTLTKQGKSLGIDYASIRKLGESKALYTRLSDTLKQAANQKNLDPTFDPTNVVQNKSIGKLYDVLAGTDLKKEYLLNAVESAGGDVNNTKQIISLLNTLRNNPVDTIIANAGKSFDMAKDGLFLGSDKLLGTIVNKFTTGRYNDAVLKLVSSGPKLQENLSKALESGIIGKSLLALNPILNKLSENAGKMVGLQAQGLSPQDNSQQGYLK